MYKMHFITPIHHPKIKKTAAENKDNSSGMQTKQNTYCADAHRYAESLGSWAQHLQANDKTFFKQAQ